MSIAANSQSPLLSENLESVTERTNPLACLGAELVYIQDATGRYLSFFLQQSERLGLTPECIVNDGDRHHFAPIDKVAYLSHLERVLTTLTPQKYQCWFNYSQGSVELELLITAIMPVLGNAATSVLVMGRLLQVAASKNNIELAPKSSHSKENIRSQEYQKLINNITRNIRRTLDLNIIWQQTVDSLGTTLKPKRCIIFPYYGKSKIRVIAESFQPGTNSMLGCEIDVLTEVGFTQALNTLKPVIVEQTKDSLFQAEKLLIVATSHQEQPNSLIVLSLGADCSYLSAKELELTKEAADQIGTAIAHATLYKELELARQQAEEASRLKSEFLANVSHEIRTPLNGMIGFLKLVLDGMADDEEEQSLFLGEAHKSSLHLLNVINDILDFAKIEAGKMELELSPVKLDELFSDVENFMRIQAEQKNLSFGMQLPDTNDQIIVYSDYLRLKQVMINLVGNAIKFTHEGHITVTADVVRKKVIFKEQEFPGMVKVRVVDTGIGVSLDQQDKLFQLFSQVDGSRTRQYGGTGLGLTISQKLVEAMGGEVHFYSLGEGLGSTVTFTLPLYQQPVMVSSPDNESEG
ncbi:MAG: GAF domain-containing protein [Richelia sp. RM2_1_2]|nr:GAF domain-containing protein [Richelia sp. SM1_7_0]NJN10727.1 GAF domain-containing protein [Richelia sp. RM1_1_1]NJO27648.1 GAF domain-containing protein [Richelia sp. SL_2_1]NJO59251.1 GAF domain-containing protein [Richelia sp. RM2_1_2]